MTGFVVTNKAGFHSYQPERFTMRATREQIIFKNKGIFTEPRSLHVALWSSANGWDAGSVTEKAFFQKGYLHYASASYQDRAIAFSTRCDDF